MSESSTSSRLSGEREEGREQERWGYSEHHRNETDLVKSRDMPTTCRNTGRESETDLLGDERTVSTTKCVVSIILFEKSKCERGQARQEAAGKEGHRVTGSRNQFSPV